MQHLSSLFRFNLIEFYSFGGGGVPRRKYFLILPLSATVDHLFLPVVERFYFYTVLSP